jgi:3-oxoacyl-[acyl-carrier-protein] synthase-1
VEQAHWGGDYEAASVVCGTSAVNGLGFTPHQIWAFRRAELTPFAEAPFMCANGFRTTLAHVRTLPPRMVGVDRMIALATQALEPIIASLAALPAGARLDFALCMPERFAGDPTRGDVPRERRMLENALSEIVKVARPGVALKPHARGHASLASAMMATGASLAKREIDVAIVGGVDTYYDPEVIDRLVTEHRIFDGENLDTFIPGEGAAFLLTARRDMAKRCRWPGLARIEAAVTGREPASLHTQLPNLALGMSRVMRAISDRLKKERRFVDLWLSDVTNENYRVHEWLLAFPRASAGVCRDETDVQFLPVLLGDLGAATMATGAVLGIEAFVRGDPQARTCVVTGASELRDRGAVLLAAE